MTDAEFDDLAEMWHLLTQHGYPLLADSLARLVASHRRLTASVEELLVENVELRYCLASLGAGSNGDEAGELTKESV